MSDFIIDPSSVSFAEIKADLTDYLNSRPDIAQWSLFLQSSAGSNLIDIVAALGAFGKIEAITARRESFIQFATNRSSIVGHSQFLGYSSYRGRNKVIKVTLVPAVSGVIEKYEYIGTVRDRYMIMESDTVVNAGVPIDVNVIIGEVLEETKISPSSNLNSFRFTKPNVSQDCRIFIGTTEIESTDNVEGMLSGKFVLQSNPLGSVDAKFLNLPSFATTYMTGTAIKLQWINLKNVDYDDSELTVYPDVGYLSAVETVSVFDTIETDTSIVVKAPLKNETSNAVRGREDQPKIFKQLASDILDASGEDISDAIMRIFLLRDGGITFTPAEKEALQKAFEPKRPHGLLPPIIEDADASPLNLDITLTLKKNSTTIPQDLVDATILPYKNTLGVIVDLPDIESSLETDVGVKIARVKVSGPSWTANSFYRMGQFVKKPSDNGLIYKAVGFKNHAGVSEPTWPLVSKQTVVDFEIVWKTIPKSDLAGISAWTASAIYKVGDQVKPSVANNFIYECIDVLFYSGPTEPSWSATIGSELNDKRLIWRTRAIEGTVPTWSSNTAYKKGDVVKATSGLTTVMFQCVGYLGKVGASQPSFSTVLDATFDDNDITWLVQDPLQVDHIAPKSQYFVISTNVVVN